MSSPPTTPPKYLPPNRARMFTMRTVVVLGIIGVLIFGVSLLMRTCQAGPNQPGIAVTPGMFYSVPLDDYDPNPLTESGGTLQHPPEGTVPIEATPFLYGRTEAEAERAGAELENPLEPTPKNRRRGQQAYGTFCQICHGIAGHGDGPIINPFPNPPDLTAPRALNLADGTIYHIITHGQGRLPDFDYANTPEEKWQFNMPAYGLQIPPEERWAIVLHVRSIQEKATEAQAEPTGDAQTGEQAAPADATTAPEGGAAPTEEATR